jgi:hypothetical protein
MATGKNSRLQRAVFYLRAGNLSILGSDRFYPGVIFFIESAYSTFPNLSAGVLQTGHLSVIGPSWVKPHTGQT